MADNVTPMERAALLAAYHAPQHTLRRTRTGFAAATPNSQAFTRRTINWLDNRAWLTFDDPEVPRAVTLTARGIARAEQLVADETSKARAG